MCGDLFRFIFDGFNLLRGATEVDVEYNRFMRFLMTKGPTHIRFKPPENHVSSAVRMFVSRKEFKNFSNACVAVNFVFMLSDHADASPSYLNFVETQNLVFYFQLLAEVLLEFAAWGPLGVLDNSWRLLDTMVTFTSSIGYITGNELTNKVAKAFRLMRIVKIMKVIKPVRIILETLVASMPSLFNVLVLIFLVFRFDAPSVSDTFALWLPSRTLY